MLDALFDRPWKRWLWFVFIAALTYLPSAVRLTYYRDDWYYAYDALVGPTGVFRALFAIDRPARAPFFEMYYALFGMSPLPYHLAMFFWRLVGGLSTLWLFSLIWPRRPGAGLAAGLLFALYPGFTWWVAGIEYQPMVASAALMVLSLGLTIQATRLGRSYVQTVCILGAIGTGWIYLSLVEYAAGMEVLRLFLIYVVAKPAEARTFRQRAALALRKWLVYLVIPAGFVVWRFLVFTSQRKATDLGAQLTGFLTDPVSTGMHWLVNFLLSFINVTFSAWVQPLMSNFFSAPLRDILTGLVLAVIAGAAGWLMLTAGGPGRGQAEDAGTEEWQIEVLWLGLAGLVLGILPIIVANRQITFPNFSHYALPGSLGAAFLVTGVLFTIANPTVRVSAFSALVVLSAMTHQGLGAAALHEERMIANFWQQMVWRTPSLAAGTTLVTYYPNLNYADDTDIVWGPANYIYHREPQAQLPIQVSISALTLDRASLNDILVGHDSEDSLYRAHTMTLNYGNVLVVAQSNADACVHVLDPRWPIFSLSDDPALYLLYPHSRADLVQSTGTTPEPPSFLFGPEPKHAWCYYFEKAELASQQGNWEAVAAIQTEVGRLGMHPNDQIEWMPFLQAQAYLGDQQKVKEIATRINTEKSYRRQACQNLSAMPGDGYPLQPSMQSYVNDLFCSGKQ